ncbi:MAG: hypothetical protein IKV77_03685 [Alistipes sp.]|jgi:hypothetical protein|nr:hypothetical protein [Alistipes sp.]
MDLKPKVSKGVLSYVVSNAGLGISEYYHLETLYKISVVISIFSSFILMIILMVYAYDYIRCKLCKEEH